MSINSSLGFGTFILVRNRLFHGGEAGHLADVTSIEGHQVITHGAFVLSELKRQRNCQLDMI